MDNIKEAFQRVKEDIISLRRDIDFLRKDLITIRQEITEIRRFIEPDLEEQEPKNLSTQIPKISTSSTPSSTHDYPLKGLKGQNMAFSTGNEGVPTDRQTDRQTDKKLQKDIKKDENSIDNVVKILDSLDNIKKEIRLKFKRLTEQEFLVFSTLYQLDEELGYSNYKIISDKLNLTESSIRDYIGRLIKKGIPVEKKRINNKNIQLSISPNFKKIASLSTILQLRDL